MNEAQTGMRIVRLTAKNIKRVTAVDIAPSGDVVVITGKNEEGKSSTLDCIWLGLEFAAAGRTIENVLRDGEKEGYSILDLGDRVIERRFKRGENGDVTSKITLKNKDGSTYPKTEATLAGMRGIVMIDPVEFRNMKSDEQVKLLLRAIGKDAEVGQLDAQRKAAYDKRTDVNRRARDLAGTLAGYGDLPADVPESEVSAAELVSRIRDIDAERERRRQLGSALAASVKAQAEAEDDISRLQQALEDARKRYAMLGPKIEAQKKELDELPMLPTMDDLNAQLAQVEQTNRIVRRAAEMRKVHDDLRAAKDESDRLTADIERIDAKKGALFTEANFMPGVSLSEQGIVINGANLKDCASSQQLRLCVEIAIAMNPVIRVILIKDGSLLDRDAMNMLCELARKYNFQIWIERVEDDSDGAIVIEDGRVRA